MNQTSQKTLQSLFVGIDLSKDFFEICLLHREGKVMKTFEISSDLKGFQELVNSLPQGSSPVFGMEDSGPFGGNLKSYLRNLNYQVISTNPFYVSRLREAFSKSAKTDRIDAFVIAQALRMNILKVSQKDEQFIFLHDLIERYYDVKTRQTALINQLKSNLVETFPEMDLIFNKIQCNASLAILSMYQTPAQILQDTLEHIIELIRSENGKVSKTRIENLRHLSRESVAWKTHDCHKAIIKSQVRELKLLNEEVKILGETIDKLVDEAFADETRLLRSVPGIGKAIAIHAIAVIGNHQRFDPEHDGSGAKRLSSFVGYGIVEKSSGHRKIKSGISKRGNPRLRGLLHMGVMTAIREDQDIKGKYDHLVASKGSKIKAMTAISHLLLRRCYGVLKSGKLYNPAIPTSGMAA